MGDWKMNPTKIVLECKKANKPTFLFGKNVYSGLECVEKNVDIKTFKALAEATGLKYHTSKSSYVAYCEHLAGEKGYSHTVEKLRIRNNRIYMNVAYIAHSDRYFYKGKREFPCPFNTDEFDYERVVYNNPLI